MRPFAPNLAEMTLYGPLLEAFDVTYFYTGPALAVCRTQLDDLGLKDLRLRRYAGYTDLVSFDLLRRVIDFKLGLGSWMATGVRDVLRHDIVNIVDPVYMFAAQLVPRLRPEQKLVIFRWELIPTRYAETLLASRRTRAALARADLIVCSTEAARDTLPLCGVPIKPDARVEVVYPGVAIPSDPSPTPNPARPHIVSVARMQWQKGIDDLLAALAILRRQHGIEATMSLIGGGPLKPWRALAKSLGVLHAVDFVGSVSNHEARRRIAEATVYCQASEVSRTWCEQFGFAVVEAMAHARPVVAYGSGVLPEIVGPDGVYASVRNASSLAAALAGVLNDPTDARQRGEQLAARARERFSAPRQGEAFRRLLEAI